MPLSACRWVTRISTAARCDDAHVFCNINTVYCEWPSKRCAPVDHHFALSDARSSCRVQWVKVIGHAALVTDAFLCRSTTRRMGGQGQRQQQRRTCSRKCLCPPPQHQHQGACTAQVRPMLQHLVVQAPPHHTHMVLQDLLERGPLQHTHLLQAPARQTTASHPPPSITTTTSSLLQHQAATRLQSSSLGGFSWPT